MKQINAQVMKSTKVQTLSASHEIIYTEHLAGVNTKQQHHLQH